MWHVTPEIQAQLESGRLIIRDYAWFVARSRDTGGPVTEGIWSGVENVSAPILDVDTGTTIYRDFYGVGTLVSISPLAMVANLTAQSCTIKASQIHTEIERIVRDYDLQQARVELFRGLFDPATHQLVTAAVPIFVGFVDKVETLIPKEGEAGAVSISCKSHMQEITRASAETRSDAYQRLRNANDAFFVDADTVSDWEHFWGSERGKVDTQKKRKKFLGIF